MVKIILLAILLFSKSGYCFADFGPLLKLVSGQLEEIRELAEVVEVGEKQMKVLAAINEGIDRVIEQIDSIEEILRRMKGLDPRSVRRISDLTMAVRDLKAIRASTNEILGAKTLIADEAISQSGVSSETAYTMGQEMAKTGSKYGTEAQHASPGRAAQIAAAASSAQMVSSGVELQTLAQLTQLQAISLELQKSQIENELASQRAQNDLFKRSRSSKKKEFRSASI